MPRYLTSVTVSYNRDTDQAAQERERRIEELLRSVFVDAQVRVTTFAEKPLPARLH